MRLDALSELVRRLSGGSGKVDFQTWHTHTARIEAVQLADGSERQVCVGGLAKTMQCFNQMFLAAPLADKLESAAVSHAANQPSSSQNQIGQLCIMPWMFCLRTRMTKQRAHGVKTGVHMERALGLLPAFSALPQGHDNDKTLQEQQQQLASVYAVLLQLQFACRREHAPKNAGELLVQQVEDALLAAGVLCTCDVQAARAAHPGKGYHTRAGTS